MGAMTSNRKKMRLGTEQQQAVGTSPGERVLHAASQERSSGGGKFLTKQRYRHHYVRSQAPSSSEPRHNKEVSEKTALKPE